MGISNGLVIALGLGIVFIGLISIIAICYIMGFLCQKFIKQEPQKSAAASVAANSASAPIANKQEIIAAVCAVIAEELGTDVSNIRVTSFKRI